MVIDYGVKRNILRALASTGVKITVVPASTTAEEILARNPDGVVLSNGPGDPAATGEYAVPVIRKLLDERVPTFGISLVVDGHWDPSSCALARLIVRYTVARETL